MTVYYNMGILIGTTWPRGHVGKKTKNKKKTELSKYYKQYDEIRTTKSAHTTRNVPAFFS